MSRIYLRSNTLVLWLSLSLATAAAALGIGCSSSSDSDTGATAGKSSGGSTGKAGGSGSANSDAGETAIAGETGEAGGPTTPSGGSDGSGGRGASGGRSGDGASGGSLGGGATGGGDAGAPGEAGAGGSPEVGGDPELEAAQARALTLINGLTASRKCTTCHQNDYSGAGFWPNLTPDAATGMGTWSKEEIIGAIHDGVGKGDVTLCATMERYSFSPDQLSDLAIYLQHLPAVSHKISAKCPQSP